MKFPALSATFRYDFMRTVSMIFLQHRTLYSKVNNVTCSALLHLAQAYPGNSAGWKHQSRSDRPIYLAPESDEHTGQPPWGSRTCYSDPEDVPDTGVVRRYDWTIQRTTLAPDGFGMFLSSSRCVGYGCISTRGKGANGYCETEQSLLTVNGQFPGPLLEANWGDIVEVTVHNNITDPDEGTAVHWHG